jgi:hypothetical protein
MRRIPRRGAGVRVVHLLRWFDDAPACGAPKRNVVPTKKPVSCVLCLRTVAGREYLSTSSIPIRVVVGAKP